MPNDEIQALKDRFIEQLSPLKVYLFGSYAYGTPGADSDYDFYIVVDDSRPDSYEQTVRAYRAIGSFRGDSKLSVWLYRLTQNVCIDFLRSKGRRPTVSLTVENEEDEVQELDVADDRFDPEEQYQRKALRDAVRRGLASLPEEYREILILREINGLSYAEIGAALQLEEGTVKSRIFRARKKLCEFLQRDGNLPDAYASKNINGGVKQ